MVILGAKKDKDDDDFESGTLSVTFAVLELAL